ncbi:SAM-dependent methyltransferase [Gloeomargarita lithophora Alchichica-D10]|uniref:SAM-dependent methyltransferase n=1 Tax=Gloeomargarita lithophora Alchichica-D10 TaxID=1188229 RepID=A0A1J0AD30_9CYAN|nr:methyltransferase domain-containing protein [Gloeomargarita lithophora]APB33825.1 SAM-dependent methyltransferase [Gloeomargarita lithophora Alchichica-D10]
MRTKLSPTTRYQNAALAYYLALTKSSYLHYGYWQPLPQSADDLTLARFRQAQADYAQKLIGMIPAAVQQILDVGCGIGGNAVKLLELGYQTDGLAPDPGQKQKFLEATAGRAGFYLSEFQSFRPSRTYDLVLMSESSQYMDRTDLARSAMRCLTPGGYLLLADMLRQDADYQKGIFSNCHHAGQLAVALAEAGFKLVQAEDISAAVAPTLDLCLENLQTFGVSTFSYIGEVLGIAVPPIHRLLVWAYNTWAKELVAEGLACREIFDRHLCYEMQLWQLP